MKNSKKILFLLLALSLTLTACGAPSVVGMPGLKVVDDVVFAAYGSDVVAVRAQDGVMVWRYPASPDAARNFFAEPEITDDLVVVGDFSNVLYGIDRSNGLEKWKFTEAKSRWIGSAVVVGDTILAPSDDSKLYALDKNGAKKWAFPAQHAIWTKPLVDGNAVYIASMDHRIYAVDLLTGNEIWQVDLGSAIVRTPLYQNGILYAGTLGGELVAVDTAKAVNSDAEKAILWRFKADGALWFTPVMQDEVLYFGDAAGKIFAIKAKNAEVVWKIEAGSAVMGSAAFTPDGLVFCSEGGNVIAVSFKGEKMWSTPVPGTGKLYSGPVVSQDRIIVAVTEGETLLMGLNLRGEKQWTFLPPKQ